MNVTSPHFHYSHPLSGSPPKHESTPTRPCSHPQSTLTSTVILWLLVATSGEDEWKATAISAPSSWGMCEQVWDDTLLLGPGVKNKAHHGRSSFSCCSSFSHPRFVHICPTLFHRIVHALGPPRPTWEDPLVPHSSTLVWTAPGMRAPPRLRGCSRRPSERPRGRRTALGAWVGRHMVGGTWSGGTWLGENGRGLLSVGRMGEDLCGVAA